MVFPPPQEVDEPFGFAAEEEAWGLAGEFIGFALMGVGAEDLWYQRSSPWDSRILAGADQESGWARSGEKET